MKAHFRATDEVATVHGEGNPLVLTTALVGDSVVIAGQGIDRENLRGRRAPPGARLVTVTLSGPAVAS